MSVASIGGIQPFTNVAPISPINSISRTNAISSSGPVNVSDFNEVMKIEVQKAIPTVPINKLESVDFNGIATFVEHRNYINRVIPAEMNSMAASFQNKIGFYDATGNAGTYDYSTYDERI